MIINKNQLIKLVASKSDYSLAQVEDISHLLLTTIQDEIQQGNAILIKGFLKLFKYRADSRPVRNFKENKHIQSGVRQLPKCEFSKSFIKRIKEK